MEQLELQKLQEDIRQASAFLSPLKTEIGRVLVGQDKLVSRLMLALIADGHVLLEGLPGLAKTLAVKTIAKAISGSYSRVQFTPDLLPADIIGTTIYNQNEHSFSVKKGPIFANIVLADEINRAPAKVQSALLECMQEKQVTIAGEKHEMPTPFLVMATQNPIEQEGTYPLPEAQVDRFMFKVEVSYPARDEERLIIERMAHPNLDLNTVAVASPEDILNARKWVDKIYIDQKVIDYVLDITIATRIDRHSELSDRQSGADLKGLESLVHYGASPRAGIAMVLAAKASAFLDGRAYVVPQDIKNVAPDVLRHRILVSYEAEAEDMNSADVIQIILDELRTP